LIFKDYTYLKPGGAGIVSETVVPHDGMIFMCPFGTYQTFWKPYNTCDIFVNATIDGLVHVDPGGQQYKVIDPKHFYIDAHIYECVFKDDSFLILNRRVDKLEQGEANLSYLNDSLDVEGNNLLFHDYKITYKIPSFTNFIEHYGRNYRTTIKQLSHLSMTVCDVRRLAINFYNAIRDQIDYSQNVPQITVTQAVKGFATISNTDVVKLWATLAKFNYILSKPYEPEVAMVNYEAKCVMRLPEICKERGNLIPTKENEMINVIATKLDLHCMTDDIVLAFVTNPEAHLQSSYVAAGAPPFVVTETLLKAKNSKN